MAYYELLTRLHVEEEGAGDPVVLIHGLTLDLRMWEPQIGPLAQHYRVIRYDMRGFGKSSDSAGVPYRDRVDLEALLDALNIRAAHVVGLSRGGRVALDFAVHYPNRLRGLVLMDTAVRLGGATSGDSSQAFRERATQLAQEGRMAEAAEEWLRGPIWHGPDGHVNPLAEKLVREYFATHTWDSRPHKVEFTEQDLPRLNMRTLVIVGEQDVPEFQASARMVAESVPGCEFVTIPEAGHIANLDNPQAVNRALLRFLAAAH